MRFDGRDALWAVGILLLGVGLWLWWPPAALMGIGGLLVVIGTMGAWLGRGRG